MSTKLLYIILDGCRPDALQLARAPRLASLWQSGAYTWTARSLMPCVTLPAHNSMFRSVPPGKHGVGRDNQHVPAAEAFPSVIEVAKSANLTTAMFYSWEPLRDLSRPGSLDMSWCMNAVYGEDNDTPVARAAAAYLVEKQPDLCVLYLGDIDITGHLYGWMSPEYMAAIETNDSAVGLVLDALEQAGLRDSYTVLVQADHGGHGTNHGSDIPEDMLIPWFISGRNIRRGHAIQSPVTLLHTAPTIARVLGLTCPPLWEGAAVDEVFVV